MSQGVKYKAVNEEINFAFDWSDWLDTDRDGTVDDTISSATWTVADGISAGTPSNTTTVSTAKITGGNVGGQYKVTCQITTTTSGEIFERFGYIHVIER